MGEYTRHLIIKEKDISIEDDDYRNTLIEITKSFRPFGEALSSFLKEHGFEGNVDNIDDKVAFISKKFDASGVPKPRNMKQWFTDSKTIENVTAIRFAFAFELDLDGANDFFRRISLTKGFDCHDIQGVVWYWCFIKGKQYSEGEAALKKLEMDYFKDVDKNSDEMVFTIAIKEEISNIEDVSELINYINHNAFQFRSNNVTASQYIKNMWEKIIGSNGLVAREIRHRNEDNYSDISKFANKIINEKDLSEWDIYRWILAIEDSDVESIKKIDKKFDRNLKEVLNKNPLVHSIVAQSFPGRNGINKTLNGLKVDSETVRKILILLGFFSFWVRKYIDSEAYFRNEKDNERCREYINDYLVRSSFGTLYEGNPYDWIFLYCMNSEAPLLDFRSFISEMIAYKTESYRE